MIEGKILILHRGDLRESSKEKSIESIQYDDFSMSRAIMNVDFVLFIDYKEKHMEKILKSRWGKDGVIF